MVDTRFVVVHRYTKLFERFKDWDFIRTRIFHYRQVVM